MTSPLIRRLEKLEPVRRGREPIGGLVLLGAEDDLERQLAEAIAASRYRYGDPLLQIALVPLQPLEREEAHEPVS